MRRLLPALLVGVVVLAGCTNPVRKVSEGSLRNATSQGAVEELKALGYQMQGQLQCKGPKSNTLAIVHVTCTGETVDGHPVEVSAIAHGADTNKPRQEFIITVDGQEVLRKPCLGNGCRDKY